MKKTKQMLGAVYQHAGRLSVLGILTVLLLGILYLSVEQGFFQNIKKQLASVLSAEACISQGEYDAKESNMSNLGDNLVKKLADIDKIKDRLVTLETEAGKFVTEIKKIQASTTPTDVLESKLASKELEIADLNTLISQRNSINTSEAGLPKTKADLQKKGTEKASLTQNLNTQKTRLASLEKIEQLRAQVDEANTKLSSLQQESDDRKVIDSLPRQQPSLLARINYWKSFKNNAAAAKQAAASQNQFDSNKARIDSINKKYTNAQGVFTLRSAALILNDYYKVSYGKNWASYSLAITTNQYNAVYARVAKITLAELKNKIEETNVAISKTDKDIEILKKEIDTVTNQLPGLKNDWIVKVKEYYKKHYNKTETITSFATVKLTDVASVESEIKKIGDSIKDIKQKNKDAIEKKQAAEIALNNQIIKINTTKDALVALQNEKESLTNSISEAKSKLQKLSVCSIPKTESATNASTTTTATSTDNQNVDSTTDDGPYIVSIYPDDGQQISSMSEAQFTVTFDRDVRSMGGSLVGGTPLVSGNQVTMIADNYVTPTGAFSIGFQLGLMGNNGSKNFSVMRTFVMADPDTGYLGGGSTGGGNSQEELNRRNGTGLLGNKCCMCIYGDFAKKGDKILKKSCDKQFAQNSCDKTKKFYARDAAGVDDGIAQFPDYCPATSYRTVQLFYEEHGDRDGEEDTMCYDFPTSIISTYLKEQGAVPENIGITHGKCNAFNNLSEADAAAKKLSETLEEAGLVNIKVTVEGNQNNSAVRLDGGNVSDVCAGKAKYTVCSSYSERTLDPCPPVGSFCLPANDNNTSMKCMEGNKTKTRTCKSEGYTENGTEYGTYQ